MSDAQLTTAARLTSAKPKQKKITRPPKARPPSVALKATPAPARGPEDELLFDPDEESFGEAGPGGGFDVGDRNVPIGVQEGVGSVSATPMGTTTAPASTDDDPEEPLIIDLEDDPKTPPRAEGGRWGITFWVLLVGGLVVCGLCLMMLWQRGGSGSPPAASSSFDPYGGLGGLGGTGAGFGGLGTGSGLM